KSAILKRQVRFCAALPASYDTDKAKRFPVIYYLHGLGENERALLPLWGLIGDQQQAGTVKQFLVITPDAGASFYINSRDGRVRYEDFFMREFIPAMEKKYRIEATRATRGIQGSSMGGYGALRFAFKYPQMFAAVAAEMPALYEKFPQRLIPYFEMSRRNAAESSPFGHPFDEAFWERNTPFTLVRENAARIRQHKLKIYFDVGSEDDYGFDEGVRQLDKLLTSLHIAHEAHVYPGGHNAGFVADHFPQALKFVSDALGK
ncbi:MAG: alpha/beta hydrolase, partial [Terriglobales bacterium]